MLELLAGKTDLELFNQKVQSLPTGSEIRVYQSL